MKKSLHFSKVVLPIAFVAATAILGSCVQDDYNLDQDNLNKDLAFGGDNFGLKLGSTTETLIGDLLDLDSEGDFKTLADGSYQLTMSQDIEPIKIEIADINVDKVDVASQIISVPKIDLPSNLLGKLTKPVYLGGPGLSQNDIDNLTLTQLNKLDGLYTLGISSEVIDDDVEVKNDRPESVEINSTVSITQTEIVHIESVDFKVADNATLNLAIQINDIEENTDVTLNSLQITLPDCLVPDATDLSFAGQTYTVTTITDNSGSTGNISIPVSIPLSGVKNSKIDGKDLVIEGDILYSYDMVLKLKDTPYCNCVNDDLTTKASAQIANIYLGSQTTADNSIGVEDVTGQFDLSGSLEQVTQGIRDIEFPETLTEDGSTLDLMNSAMDLSIESNLPLPIDFNLKLAAYSSETEVALGSDGLPIEVSVSDVLAKGESSIKMWLCENNTSGDESYDFREEDISALLNCVPEKIEVVFTPEDKSAGQTITIKPGLYSVTPKVNVVAPLQMGKDMKMSYSIEDIFDISSLASTADALELAITGVNTLPLNAKLEVVIVDEEGNSVSSSDVSATATGVLYSVEETAKSESDTMKIALSGDLSKAASLNLDFNLSSSEALNGGFLKSTNSIKLSISAKIPGGISIDLDEFMGDDEEDDSSFDEI